jgi:hypothetical protein
LTIFVVRICVGTWNVGGKLPHDDLDIDDWIDTDDPADIYVFGYVFPCTSSNVELSLSKGNLLFKT